MRWKVAVAWRGVGDNRQDRERVVNDLVDIGPFLAEGPKGWLTAYICVTELVDREKPVAKLTVAEAA